MHAITTLQQLADYINDYAEKNPESAWDHKTVDHAINANNWTPADDFDTYTVCSDSRQKLVLNDLCLGAVIDITEDAE